ncbi:hypothetical protein L218DRAFT_1007690 [Marasmius fiardii PR-910]|nr:hypothetical protein L218DRAFT_1007690 [Marasmius fiardii PR-910]
MLHLFFSLLQGLLAAQFACSSFLLGQDSQWSYEQRVTFASNALDTAVRDALLGPNGSLVQVHGTSETPILYAQLAEYDIITQKTTYKETIAVFFMQAAKGIFTKLYALSCHL